MVMPSKLYDPSGPLVMTKILGHILYMAAKSFLCGVPDFKPSILSVSSTLSDKTSDRRIKGKRALRPIFIWCVPGLNPSFVFGYFFKYANVCLCNFGKDFMGPAEVKY